LSLIEHKAALNASDRDAMTPLHLATIAGDCNIVKLLLDSNANIELPDKVPEFGVTHKSTNSHIGVLFLHLSRMG
jgi:ankyrin repeat protein